MSNLSHAVYPDGPPCSSQCPGTWSEYHDGYGDGYEAAERSAGAAPLCPDCGLSAQRIGEIHITAQVARAEYAKKQTEGTDR